MCKRYYLLCEGNSSPWRGDENPPGKTKKYIIVGVSGVGHGTKNLRSIRWNPMFVASLITFFRASGWFSLPRNYVGVTER